MGTLQPAIYFDNAATTPLLPEALESLTETSRAVYGNSSSAHAIGKRSAAILDGARRTFSEIFNVPANHILFTSGGTESNNLALWGSLGGITNAFHWLRSPRCQEEQLLTTTVEHPATQKLFEQFDLMGADIAWTGVNTECVLDSSHLGKALAHAKRIRYASIHHVHNEIGVVQPIAEISRQIRAHSPDAVIHMDAVQSFSKVAIDMQAMGIDLLSLSAHKAGGPKGIGALILGPRFASGGLRLGPFLIGSGQQDGLRPGTVPVPLIAAFETASRLGTGRLSETRKKLLGLRTHLVQKLPKFVQINGPADLSENNPLRAPQTLNFSLMGINSSMAVERLSAEGICLSAAAACLTGSSSASLSGSQTILKMGLGSERAQSSVRASFSTTNTTGEIDCLCGVLGRF